MTQLELIQRIADNHNRIAQIAVSGDSAILLGDTLKDLRMLVQELQVDGVDVNPPAETQSAKPIRKARKSGGADCEYTQPISSADT